VRFYKKKKTLQKWKAYTAIYNQKYPFRHLRKMLGAPKQLSHPISFFFYNKFLFILFCLVDVKCWNFICIDFGWRWNEDVSLPLIACLPFLSSPTAIILYTFSNYFLATIDNKRNNHFSKLFKKISDIFKIQNYSKNLI